MNPRPTVNAIKLDGERLRLADAELESELVADSPKWYEYQSRRIPA